MTILDELLESINQDAPVHSVMVGAHWTAVCSQHCGLASTLMADRPHPATRVRDVGRLHKKNARELAEFARSDDLLEASIGVAALNSLLPRPAENIVEINAFNILAEKGKWRNVTLVGHFPFIPRLRALVGQLWVIEQQPSADSVRRRGLDFLVPTEHIRARYPPRFAPRTSYRAPTHRPWSFT